MGGYQNVFLIFLLFTTLHQTSGFTSKVINLQIEIFEKYGQKTTTEVPNKEDNGSDYYSNYSDVTTDKYGQNTTTEVPNEEDYGSVGSTEYLEWCGLCAYRNYEGMCKLHQPCLDIKNIQVPVPVIPCPDCEYRDFNGNCNVHQPCYEENSQQVDEGFSCGECEYTDPNGNCKVHQPCLDVLKTQVTVQPCPQCEYRDPNGNCKVHLPCYEENFPQVDEGFSCGLCGYINYDGMCKLH